MQATESLLSCQFDRFSLPENLHYLNCAYMSPLLKEVEEAGIAGIRQKRVPSAISPEDFFEDSDAVRSLFSDLINAQAPNSIAILPAASYGIATAAKNTHLEAGQKIVLLREQFPSNVYTWMRLAERSNAELQFIDPPVNWENRGERWNQAILDAIDASTGLVALPHVHWTDGTIFDLEAIGRQCRAVGAAFVVDGTQSVGAFPFDVQAIQPDALICAGYKWLLGPYTIGAAYFGPRYLDGIPLEENWITRRNSEQFGGLVEYETHYQPGAIRFDVGERSNFIGMPMLRRALEEILAWEVHNIQAYCTNLVKPYLEEAAALGYQLEEETWRSHHLFGIRASETTKPRLKDALQRHQISVSMRGSAVRVSPHVYNGARDMDALLAALREAAS